LPDAYSNMYTHEHADGRTADGDADADGVQRPDSDAWAGALRLSNRRFDLRRAQQPECFEW
jgi:hypothetical protein